MTPKKHIVVLIYGWVLIGHVEQESKSEVTLVNAAVVRVWGTTRGLGELALKGPTNKTILDDCGIVQIPKSSIVLMMEAPACK